MAAVENKHGLLPLYGGNASCITLVDLKKVAGYSECSTSSRDFLLKHQVIQSLAQSRKKFAQHGELKK